MSRVGGWVRTGAFAVVGTVLAAFGHHTVAEGPVPWALVLALAAAQFALFWPVARRRRPLPVVVACTLVAQGALHGVLTVAGGSYGRATDGSPGGAAASSYGAMGGHSGPGHSGVGAFADHPGPGHSGMSVVADHPTMGSLGGHPGLVPGDGHSWHHAGFAMTAAHLLAAAAVAWLLHRADSALTSALDTARTAGRAAGVVLARVLPRLTFRTARAATREPMRGPLFGYAAPPAPTGTGVEALAHAVVRRGPPRGTGARRAVTSGA
ncbi:hypothetical protein ACFVT5_16590 [Streptomyces sp. NPDC058001]|uniref:hypothetical protein n=1 Tax=Streptomyces sp. NPDC058001 TaxID=3346300 RepID=UPI0036EA7515